MNNLNSLNIGLESKISFAKKYRPVKIFEVIGQNDVKLILQNALKGKINLSSILFYGDRGSGKTSMARIFAAALNCENLEKNGEFEPCGQCDSCISIKNQTNLDIFEIDAASNTGVENIRDIIENSKYLPQIAKKKIYILDEVHMLSASAFNALLKILEEPPEYVCFILVTTEYKKLPLTIISRCMRFQFKKINQQEIENFLEKICLNEQIKSEKNALKMISHLSAGSMRDALSLLESASILTKNDIKSSNLPEIFGILNDQKMIFSLLFGILKKNLNFCFEALEDLFAKNLSIDLIFQSMINLINELIIYQTLKRENPSKALDQNLFEFFIYLEENEVSNFFLYENVSFKNLDNIVDVFNKAASLLMKNFYQDHLFLLKITIIKSIFSLSEKNLKKAPQKNSSFQNEGIFKMNVPNNNDGNYGDHMIDEEIINISDRSNQKALINRVQEIEVDRQENIIEENNNQQALINQDQKIEVAQQEEEEEEEEESSQQECIKDKLQINENHPMKEELIIFLKQSDEVFLSDLILQGTIILDYENQRIIDDNSVPSKNLQYLLKILRENFSKTWRIFLGSPSREKSEISNQREKSINIDKTHNFININNNHQSTNYKPVNQPSKNIDKNQNHLNHSEIKSPVDIKKDFLNSKIAQEFKDIFFICDDDIKIIK